MRDKRILHPYPRFPENLQREAELAQPRDRRAHRPGISYQGPGAGLFRGDERPLRPGYPAGTKTAHSKEEAGFHPAGGLPRSFPCSGLSPKPGD